MCTITFNRSPAFVTETSSMSTFNQQRLLEHVERNKDQHFDNLCNAFEMITLHDFSLLGLQSDQYLCSRDQIYSSQIYMAWIAFVFQDGDGDTVLHRCIIQGIKEAALHLIETCPDSNLLDTQNRLFQTALHLAVLTKQTTVVKRLVERGASVTCQDHRGDTVLHIVCRGQGDLSIVKILAESQTFNRSLELRNCEGLTCLHLTAMNDNLSLMQFLVERNADVNAREFKSGQTALHWAAENGNSDVLNFLFALPGVDINALTYGGNTALEIARVNSWDKVFMEMLYNGSKAEDMLIDV